MKTVQLRRYQIKAGMMEEFVEGFPAILAPRRQYGFEALFAFVDESTNQFVWAVSHEGNSEDFDHAEKTYFESPEAVALTAAILRRAGTEPGGFVEEPFITKVEVIHQIWPAD